MELGYAEGRPSPNWKGSISSLHSAENSFMGLEMSILVHSPANLMIRVFASAL